VLAEWGLGAYISCLAERPTVATNFGWETHGLFESTAFLVQSDPLLADQLLEENRVRYLLLSDVTGQLPNFRAIAEYGMVKKGQKPLAPFVPLATMYYRLYVQDGSAYAVQGVEQAALGRYRLIYESLGQAPEQVKGTVSHYKIFEYVPGVELAGNANPESIVTVELPLRTRNGRRFHYFDRVVVKNDGTFSLRVPYATLGGASYVSAEGDYRLTVNGRTRSIQVLPGEVVTGARKQLVL
jgi:asparagine N-glycosylation enzyme membrane subunit Stt3